MNDNTENKNMKRKNWIILSISGCVMMLVVCVLVVAVLSVIPVNEGAVFESINDPVATTEVEGESP